MRVLKWIYAASTNFERNPNNSNVADYQLPTNSEGQAATTIASIDIGDNQESTDILKCPQLRSRGCIYSMRSIA